MEKENIMKLPDVGTIKSIQIELRFKEPVEIKKGQSISVINKGVVLCVDGKKYEPQSTHIVTPFHF